MNNIYKRISIHTLSNIISSFINIVIFSYLAHILSIEEMGHLVLFTALLTFFSYIVPLELQHSYDRFYYESKIENFESNLITLLAIVTLLTSLVLLFFYDLINTFIPISLNLYIILLLIAANKGYQTLFFIKLRFLEYDKFYFVSSILQSIISVILFFLLSIWFDYITSYFTAILLSILMVNIYNFIYLFKTFSPVIQKEAFKKSLKFSLWLVPGNLSNFIFTFIDRIMLQRLLNSHSVGIYGVHLKTAQYLMVILNPLYSIIHIKILKSYKNEGFNKIFNNYFDDFYAILLFLTLFTALFAKEIILIFAGEKYLPYLDLTYLFLFINFLLGLSFFLSDLIHLAQKTHIDAFIEITSGFMNVVLNYFLIIEYHIYGAVMATLFTLFLRFLLYFLFAKKFFIFFNVSLVKIVIYLLLFVGVLYLGYLLKDEGVIKYIFFLFISIIFFYFIKQRSKQIGYE